MATASLKTMWWGYAMQLFLKTNTNDTLTDFQSVTKVMSSERVNNKDEQKKITIQIIIITRFR